MSGVRAATENVRGSWRLFGPAILSWALAAVLVHVPGTSRVVAVVVVVACVGLVISAVITKARANNGRQTGALGIFLIAGAMILFLCVRIEVYEQARQAAPLTAAAESAGARVMVAQLAGYPEELTGFGGESRSWVQAKLMKVEGERLATAVRVMLWFPSLAPAEWAPGTPVQVTGVLKRAPPESAAAFEVQVNQFSEASGTEGRSFIGALGQYAAGLRVGLRHASATLPGAELVPGFAIGDTALVSAELDDLMKESSLTHLVAVSGSNTGLVITFFIAVASFAGAGRRVRIVIGAISLGLFIVCVGPDASVQRASVMAIVLLVSGFGGKRGRALPALGLAVFVLLAIDPWQAVQAGFALSVAATAGILLFAAPTQAWLSTRLRLPKLLSLPFAVACVAQFSVAPLLLLLQPGLPVGGVIANLLAAPAAPIGTGLGLAALVALPIAPPLGMTFLFLAMLPARWVEAAGELAVALPGSRWYWPGGWGGALLLAGVEALALIAVLLAAGRIEVRGGTAMQQRGPWGRVFQASTHAHILFRVLASVACGVMVAVTIVVPVSAKIGVPRDWIVVMCDVGQGDAILLRDPEQPHHTILVDTGDDEAKLEECLELFGVQEIALLILTHDDRDHVGALSVVVERSRQVMVSPAAANPRKQRALTIELDRAPVPWTVGEAGMRGGDWSSVTMHETPGLRWEVLAPPSGTIPETTNAASLVVMVSVAGQQILLLGDTGEAEQRKLQRAYPDLRADIVKVAHHGSKDQLSGFYQSLGARHALISVGEKNRHGHPHDDVLDSLSAAATSAFRTDQLGSLALRLRESEVEPWAAGARSNVSVGATG